MGVLDEIGVGGVVPKIDITGLASSTWIWVLVVAIIGLIFIGVLCFFLYFMTYNKKIVFFENISGQGYQPVLKTRARTIKLGVGGEELLKTFRGGQFLSTSGKKMGRNTYWYAKGQDGYPYNILLGDLDAKMGMLDIEPVDRDVRMFHVALDRLSHQTYGKTTFMEKYGVHMMLFLFLIVLILGMWFIVGKIGDAVAPLGQSTDISLKIQQTNLELTSKLESIVNLLRGGGVAGGLAPAVITPINNTGGE